MSSHRSRRLKLSPRARQDFIDILRYTGETWGERQLLIYRDKINDALQALSATPELGHSRSDLSPTHRTYSVGSHIIVFRIIEDSIGVVRILHQRMDLAKHFRSR